MRLPWACIHNTSVWFFPRNHYVLEKYLIDPLNYEKNMLHPPPYICFFFGGGELYGKSKCSCMYYYFYILLVYIIIFTYFTLLKLCDKGRIFRYNHFCIVQEIFAAGWFISCHVWWHIPPGLWWMEAGGISPTGPTQPLSINILQH